jgi:hypothetical protein
VELLIAVSLMGVVTAVAFLTFSTVVTAWQRGQAVSDRLHYGDFVMEQLVTGLRSTYYHQPAHGFILEDEGEGESTSDVIEWVKLGNSLVGDDALLSAGPHRVRFGIETDDHGESRVAVRAVLLTTQQTNVIDWADFKPAYLSAADRVTGFNCRIGKRDVEGELEWEDEWEDTNSVPEFVELTLFLKPVERATQAIELKRVVHIRPVEGATRGAYGVPAAPVTNVPPFQPVFPPAQARQTLPPEVDAPPGGKGP